MTFKNKAEAKKTADEPEARGDRCADAAGTLEAEKVYRAAEEMMRRTHTYRAEAARIRALLPTLPE